MYLQKKRDKMILGQRSVLFQSQCNGNFFSPSYCKTFLPAREKSTLNEIHAEWTATFSPYSLDPYAMTKAKSKFFKSLIRINSLVRIKFQQTALKMQLLCYWTRPNTNPCGPNILQQWNISWRLENSPNTTN